MNIETRGITHRIDGGWTVVMGPCSSETPQQIFSAAEVGVKSGAHILRSGNWKPRTNPDSWQGVGAVGIDWMNEAKRATGIAIATEVNSPQNLLIALKKGIDMVWIGTRTGLDYELLKEVGILTSDTQIPVMIKRNFGSTLEEWLRAAEYVVPKNPNVILCERGIRTFNTAETRFTLDLQTAYLAQQEGYPVFIDPSHAAGRRDLIKPMSLAAEAAGFNGLMIEAHPDPDNALTDARQQISLHDFSRLMQELNARRSAKEISISIPSSHPESITVYSRKNEAPLPIPLETYVSNDEVSDVYIQSGIVKKLPKWLLTEQEDLSKTGTAPTHYVILTDENVAPLYAQQLIQQLQELNLSTSIISVPAGEHSKTLEMYAKVCGTLTENGCDRNTILLAVGGGVVGDLGGYVASTYKRGIRFIQVPTSLISQVDACYGGKTGLDTPEGKNMLGTFISPMAIFVDPELLRTLPKREIVSGLGEIIKYGAIDAEVFTHIEENIDALLAGDTEALSTVIKKCLAIKSEFVQADPEDHGVRQVLNFGHTIGQAIEVASDYSLTHGEAIAIGMAYEAELGVKEGCWTTDEKVRFIKLLQKAGLPTEIPNSVTMEKIIMAVGSDKKRKGKKIKFAIPMGISSGMIEGFHTVEIPLEEVKSLF